MFLQPYRGAGCGAPIGPIHPVGPGAAMVRGLLVQGVGKCVCECRGWVCSMQCARLGYSI